MIMRKKLILVIVTCILITNTISAQLRRIKFEHISLQEGLSQSSVSAITRDSKGFMWFATLDGLNLYDGYDIRIYYNSEEPGDLPDNVINVVYSNQTDKNAQLWIGTDAKGICKYNRITDKFENYQHSTSNYNSINSNNILSIWGSQNTLWVGTGKGLNKYNTDTDKWTRFSYTKNTRNLQKYNTVKCIIGNNSNQLWLGTNNGILLFDGKTDTYKESKITEITQDHIINHLLLDSAGNLWAATSKGLYIFKNSSDNYEKLDRSGILRDNSVNVVLEDKNNQFWIGTANNGLFHYNRNTNEFVNYKHDPSDNNSLVTNNIISLFLDKSNILWVGCSLGGINKWNRAAEDLAVFRHNPYDDYSLSSNMVRSIFEDSKGTIWIGTVDGGLNKWNQKENKFDHFTANPDIPNSISNNHVRSIKEDKSGKLWLGTDGGGLNSFDTIKKVFTSYYANPDNAEALSSNRIWRLHFDKKGLLWLATYGGGLNVMNMQTYKFKRYMFDSADVNTISSNLVTSVMEDSKGRFWVGTMDGFNRFNPETGAFKRYFHDIKNKNSLSNNRIYSIIEDSKGRIWIGTKGGLNEFNPENETFNVYTTKSHEIPNNVIMGIVEDTQGFIWITTNRGISKINIATGKVRNFDMRDGLQSNEFLVGSHVRTRDNEIILGGINGFNAFFPDQIRDNQNVPALVLTGFMVSNNVFPLDSAVSEKKVIHLNYKQTNIAFQFVALDYIFPAKNQYAYQLIGYDDSMQYVKYLRLAKYTNLPPKKYVFKVIGSNNDEIWNTTGTEIEIIIHPAYWQTLWFKIVAVAAIVLIIASIVYLRFRILHQQKQHLENQVQLRTKQVVEQKNEIEKKNTVLEEQKSEILKQNKVLEQQKEEIESQRDEIEKHRDILFTQKKEITDSIRYAKRIQSAALPQSTFLGEILPSHFILFKPRDIVSGDFYWAGKQGDYIIIAAADCTGHGVPGAFMSMLGMTFLNEIVNEYEEWQPDKILNILRDNIIGSLKQTGGMLEPKDGMDIAICCINLQLNKAFIASANNPLYIARNNEIIIFESDPMPIAIYELMQPFTIKQFDLQKNDTIYLFSDGFPDQFGGPKGKKYMYKKFRSYLAEISHKDTNEQYTLLKSEIENWITHTNPNNGQPFEQTDDILVIGIKI